MSGRGVKVLFGEPHPSIPDEESADRVGSHGGIGSSSMLFCVFSRSM